MFAFIKGFFSIQQNSNNLKEDIKDRQGMKEIGDEISKKKLDQNVQAQNNSNEVSLKEEQFIQEDQREKKKITQNNFWP